MGWRFRRTLSMGGFRWTLSKSGVGGSWGLAGILRFGLSPDGRRYVSVRVPGTGVSWVKYYGRTIGSPSVGSGHGSPAPSMPQPSKQAGSQNPNRPGTTSQPWWNQPWWKQKGP